MFVAAKKKKKKRCVTAAAATAYVCVFVCMFDRHAVRYKVGICTATSSCAVARFYILLNEKQPGDWPL